MRPPIRLITALMVVGPLTANASTQRTSASPVYVRTGGVVSLVSRAEIVLIGKVIEIEPDQVEATIKVGAKNVKTPYKVAVVNVDEPLLGAAGLTRVRVGFPLKVEIGDWNTLGMPLTIGMEGSFSLDRHPSADFYILTVVPLDKKEKDFERDMERLRKLIKAISDPVSGLKAKELKDRFRAARVLLERNLMPHGSDRREPIPDEENKLIIAVLSELPWNPKDGAMFGPDRELAPCRRVLWYTINPGEFGFKEPERPTRQAGDPPPDFNKQMEEATSKFLKENADKIKLKRFVQN
jgi:hypothetical protein